MRTRTKLRRPSHTTVVAYITLFLVISGGAAYAAGHLGMNSVGTKQLKKNSVTTAKIKKNAVTTAKIKAKAVTAAKIKDGSVGLAKLATGASSLGTATGRPVPANDSAEVPVPLAGTTTFTPQAGTVYFLSVEAKGELDHLPGEACNPTIVPIVNGNEWEVAEGFLQVRAQEPEPNEPTGKRPVSAETGPLGLLSPGVPQTIAAKLIGDPECTGGSTVSVAIAITQAK
ncbi:MAG: hypothetical protein ACXVBG_23065 [Isosphaeraceae bacterium]